MYYNRLGKSGLKLSALSLGSWLTFASDFNVEKARECIKVAIDYGVNFFDNAEVYANGESERIMGQAIKDFRREDLVLSTKIFWGGDGPNDKGLSWKHLVEGTKNSLKRMDQDYVDLLFCHRPDPNTPIEETVRAMDHIIQSGLAFYWGTSEWSAKEIEDAHMFARQINARSPLMEQPEYHMLHRERFENEYAPLYEKFDMGTTIWSPLAQGLLTGKYNDGIPENSRFAKNKYLHQSWDESEIAKVRLLGELADDLTCSLAQLAIAWCLKNPRVSTVITGSSSIEQIHENMKAVDVIKKLNSDVMEKIESILQNKVQV